MSENPQNSDPKADAFHAIFGVRPNKSIKMRVVGDAIVFHRLSGFAREVVNCEKEVACILLRYKNYRNHGLSEQEMLEDYSEGYNHEVACNGAYDDFHTAWAIADHFGFKCSENVKDYIEEEPEPIGK